MRTNIYRREFLKTAVTTGAAFGFPSIVPSSVFGAGAPSNRVNIGVIGCGGRCIAASVYNQYEKSQVLAVCDPIEERRLDRQKVFKAEHAYNDFRDLLARDDIDAVHIATADHWHVPISLAAARAGKDMYTEKALGISIEQDLAARQIVDKYKRVFQYGTQQRSMIQIRYAHELVLNGHIGEVKEIYVWAPKGLSGRSATPVLEVPKGFDYDMWLGPAPVKPFCKDRCQDNKGIFHIYDYALGFIAGWGAHPLDQLQWWAEKAGRDIPVTYEGTGTIPKTGLYDTLTHWDVTCTYDDGVVMRFVDSDTAEKIVPYKDKFKSGNGTLLIGETGWVAAWRGGWMTSPVSLLQKGKDPGPIHLIESKNHQENFIDAVLERKQPVSNLHSAVRSDLISHLSDICIRTGRKITWDKDKETITGDEDAAKMMSRPMRSPWSL
jgi:predicted dehydrogenase